MNYLIYTRVSPRGSGWTGETSCETQAEECKRHISPRDPEAVYSPIVEEVFKTATNNARPKLQAILSGISAAAWDVLVVLDMDRLARSQEGWIEIAKTLAQHNKGLICVRQNADFSSIQGRFMLSLFSILGEYFAKQNAQKTRDKMLHMARQGLWPCGIVPYGYMRKAKGDNALALDPKTSAIAEDIFHAYAGGESTTSLSKRLNLSNDRIERMLRNPVYIGRIDYGGVTAEGKHPALISTTVFDAVNKRLPGKQSAPRPQRQKYGYLLAGRVMCACGKTMTASHATGEMGKKYPYYRCSDPRCKSARKMVRSDTLDSAVLKKIADTAENNQEIIDIWKKMVLMKITMEQQNDGELPEWRVELEKIQKRIANLSKALQGGQLGPVTMRNLSKDLEALYRQAEAITAKIEGREEEIEALTPPDTAEQLAKVWRDTARDLADGDWPFETKLLWANAHIKEIVVQNDDVSVFFALMTPFAQTAPGVPFIPVTRTSWICEMKFKLPRRRAA